MVLAQDSKEWQEQYNLKLEKIEKRIKKEFKKRSFHETKLSASYCAYTHDENDLPVDNLDEIAVHGKCQFNRAYYDERFGIGSFYSSDIMENPTFMEVFLVVNQMMNS